MIVDYELTPSDYIAFSLYHNATLPTVKKSIRLMRWALPALWLTYVLFPVAFGEPLGATHAVVVGLAILWVALIPPYFRWSIRRNAGRYFQRGLVNGQIGPHRVELTDTGIRDTTPLSDWHMGWAGVERVAEGPDHLFVYVGAHAAHIVPKHALGDRVDIFRQAIEQRTASVRPPSLSPSSTRSTILS
jgi:hypothetical protein